MQTEEPCFRCRDEIADVTQRGKEKKHIWHKSTYW